MDDYSSVRIGPNRANWDVIEEDVARITEAVRDYLPEFPEPGVHEADEYHRQKPIAETGAWHYDGELYFTDVHKQSEKFPSNTDTIHEMGHAVGRYIGQTVAPPFTDILTALDNEGLQQIGELPEEEQEILSQYVEVRSELSSGHFAAAFEHSLRNELGISMYNVEGEKKYADAEDGLVDGKRDHFWEEEDEASLPQFLYTAVQEAENRREDLFELLPDNKTGQIDHSTASEVWK